MKFIFRTVIIIVILFFLTFLGINIFLKSKEFGNLPKGERLEKIKLSKNYNIEKGEFEYIVPTVVLVGKNQTEGANSLAGKGKRLYEFITGKNEAENTIPEKRLPSVKTDLKNLNINENLVVWLGHSSIYAQLNGKRILVDPVLEKAFPLPITMIPFEGTDVFSANDIPEIDILILTHDHWDHLNYLTIMKIKDRVKNIVVPLGVGEHLEYWGVDMKKVYETDWGDTIEIGGMKIHTLPARHFSGRGLIRNKTLWASFLVESFDYKLFFNGDSGYGPHFKEIGNKFGKIDFVAMEAGQYNEE